MRRDAAARYLKETFGFGSVSLLAKGVVTGAGPIFFKRGPIVLYRQEDLDEYALSKISGPLRATPLAPDAKSSERRGRPRKTAEG
jgi:hypothetical protein